jgi:O-antigen ligase
MTLTTGNLVRRSRGLWGIAAIGLSTGLVTVALAPLASNSVAYVVGVPVLAVGALVVLRDWRVGVILAAAALPVAGVTAPGMSTSVFRLIVVTTTVSAGVRLASDKALRERLSRLVHCTPMVVLSIYLGWIALSVLWALRTDLWLTHLVADLGFVLLAALVGLADRRTIGRIWTALLISSVIAIPLAPLFGRSTEVITEFQRLSIGGGGPNEKAALLAVVIGVAMARGYAENRSRLLSVVAVLILGSAILLTGSRSGTAALIAVVVGSVLLANLNRRNGFDGLMSMHIGRTVAIWAGAAVLFLVAVFLITDRVDTGLDFNELAAAGTARVASLTQLNSGVDLSGREEIWPVMFASVGEHPILGVGAGNAEIVSANAGVYRGSDSTRGAGPHNTILTTLVEGGVIGAALYLAAWLTAAAYLVALWRRGEPFAGALALGVLAWTVAGLALQLQDHMVAALLFGSILALWLSDTAVAVDDALDA